MNRWAFVLVVSLGLLFSLGCVSSNWWDEPPQMEGKISAVGMARFVGNEALSRTSATANARRTLAAFVKTQIQSLTETWGKQAGDDVAASKVSNYFNDENITRELIDTTLSGAIPVQYEKHGKYLYALVVIDIAKFAHYWKDIGSKSMDLDKTLILSEAMKENYSNKMDKLIKDYLQKVSSGLQAK